MSTRLGLNNPPGTVPLTAVVTRVDVDETVDWFYVNADADVFVVQGEGWDDGDVLPTRGFYRVPSGTSHPIPYYGKRVGLAAVTTANAWLIAVGNPARNTGKCP